MNPATQLQRAIDALESARKEIDRATAQLFALESDEADDATDALTEHYCGLRDVERRLIRAQARLALRVIGGVA